MNLLIVDKNDLQNVVSVNGDLEYDQIKPHIRSAQEQLARYVGRELLVELGDSENLTDAQKELRPYLQVPIANIALIKYVSSANVLITDVGVMRTKNANQSDAFEWQVDRLVTSLQQTAADGIEALLRYLGDHLDDFPSFATAREYDLIKTRLIQSAEIFNRYYEIGSSRLVFETLRAAMITSEVRLILPALGSAMPALIGDELTDNQKNMLDAARRALVYATMARALRERLVSINENGVQIHAISQFATIRYQQPPDEKQLAIVLTHFDAEAAIYLQELIALVTPPSTETTTGSRVIGTKIVGF